MSLSEDEIARRIADARARVVDPMLAEEDRLRADYPGRSDAWYSQTASRTVQLANQQRRPWWQFWG